MMLAEEKGRVVSRDTIMERFWGLATTWALGPRPDRASRPYRNAASRYKIECRTERLPRAPFHHRTLPPREKLLARRSPPRDAGRRHPSGRFLHPPSPPQASAEDQPQRHRLLTAAVLASTLAIAGVLDDWHDAASKADEARYFAHFTADAVFLGTDDSERWDKTAFQTYAHPHFSKGKGWTLKPSDRHTSVSPDGMTAWFDEKVLSPNYGPSRGSGVLLLQNGRWLIAQYNLTVPVPNGLLMKVAGMIKAGWPAPGDIDVKAAAALLEARKGDKDLVVLDVRTPSERAAGRIAGSAHVDFQAANFKDELAKLDKSKTYLVHCAKGGRSAKTLSVMKEAGFSPSYNLLGGLTAWEAASLPVEK